MTRTRVRCWAGRAFQLLAVLTLLSGVAAMPGGAEAQEMSGSITGSVRGPDGLPIVGVSVLVEAASGGDPWGYFWACSDQNSGQYSIAGLPLDQPITLYANLDVCFPNFNVYGGQFWPGAGDYQHAQPIILTNAAPVRADADFTLEKYPVTEYLVFNFDNPILGELSVRQAIAHGLDRQRILNEAKLPNGEYGTIPNSYVADNHWAKAPDSVLAVYDYDPDLARQILTNAGWIDIDQDGVREKGGQRLSLMFRTTTRASRMATGDLFQEMMADIGMEVATSYTSNPIFQNTYLFTGDFDVAAIAPALCLNSQDEACVPSSAFLTNAFWGSGNYGHYSNPAADAEYEAGIAATTREEKLPYAIQHQVIISQDLPILALSTRDLLSAGITETGSTVTPLPELSISFGTVAQSGITGAITVPTAPSAPPTGFQVLGQVYEIATNAAFEAAQVCLNYEDGNLADESLVRLFHEEGGAWVDVTDAGYPDTSLNKVCGTVTSFSPFAAGLTLNSAPSNVVVASLAEPQQAGTSITAFASFDDPDQGDTHTFTWDWGDGSALEVGAQSAVHAYATPGVYTITVTVADAAGASAEGTSQFVVIYDPDGGFVTGGGWINSPLGAYAANPSLTGKATFGFVSKYLKGANVPSGNTEFQFKVADFSFKSTSYDWLVAAGAKAQFKGSGTINGAGDYGFMLTATDGQVSGGGEADRFRIKIWDKATGDAIYDNQMGEINDALPATELQGGSIVVHK